MSEYKRLVAYIYLYDNGKRIRNIGFTKAEAKDRECRIQVHIKGAWTAEGSDCDAYIFYREREKIRGIFIGNFSLTNGAGELKCVTDARNIQNTGRSLSDMNGIIIRTKEGKIFATRWDDEPIRMEDFEYHEKIYDDRKIEETADIHAEEVTEDPSVEDLPVEEQPAELSASSEHIDPVRLLEYGEAGRRLVNNSFMLHGYYNHGYLLLLHEKDGGLLLGVPGEFSVQEKMMAVLFGFPMFDTAEKVSEENGNTGYWLRRIENGSAGKIYESGDRTGEAGI